jgi:arylsulfatase A-like enzyme/methionine-rich copper-binding protein CopC
MTRRPQRIPHPHLMNRNISLSICILAASVLTASADHYQVYLLGGQSNGNGRADAAQLTAPLSAVQTDVRLYYLNNQDENSVLPEEQWIDLAPGSGHGTTLYYATEFGPEVSFGRAMADAKPTENIAIIKYTHGGTNLYSQWSASGDKYATFVTTVQAALAALTTAGDTYELRGMLWQQGEADTGGTAADNYQSNLTDLIARVRTDLNGGAAFPFVIGSLSDSQYSNITTAGSGPYKVRQAQEAVAAADATVGIVLTDGFGIQSDGIHFDHNGQVALGQGHAARMLALEGASPSGCGNRPNVIFLIGDDQSWYDYSFMYRADVEKAALDANPGIKQVAKTPAIDRLADEGIAFVHGYTTPLCRPSLAAMVTGTHPHQNWITGNDLAGRPPDQEVEARMQVFHPLPHTLATRLGYTSFQTGKWWEGHHTNGGFTAGDTVNSTAGGTAPPQWSGGRPGYVTARHGDWGLMTGRVDYVNDVAAPAHPIPYANTVETVTDFIDTQVAADQPFFLWYAPFLPHTPHDPPSGLLAEYTALGLGSADAKYYANVERFDGGVGAILDHLDATGITNNTLVVMICDNGRDQADPVGKQFPYDSGVRTPIIVRWPDRIKPGGTIEPQIIRTPVSLIDMVPTVHHALGLPIYPEMTGIDLLDPGAVAARDTVFGADYTVDIRDLDDPSQSLESRFATRAGWKLIRFVTGTDELYHLYDDATGTPVDPLETNDLSASNPALVAELTTAIDDWYDTPQGRQLTTSEASSFSVANGDLLQTALDATTPVVTTGDFTDVGGTAVTGEPALRNGVWDNDASGRGDAGTGDGATATYSFDLAASPLGYTIDQIDLYSNWGPAQDRDEIRVSIDYALVASPTNFDNHIVINEAYDPPTRSQGKMSITNIGTPGVAAIRFTWPASQEGGAVGYAELDVFGTADGSDTTPALISFLTPDNGATDAPTGGDLVAGFCEPIRAGTGLIRLFESDGTPVETFDVNSSPRLTIANTSLTIDPTSDLVGGTSYYVLFDATAVEDLAGNGFDGFSDPASWAFTADGTAPSVFGLVPADNATDVPTASSFSATFDEDIQPGSGFVRLFTSDGTPVEAFNVASSPQVTISGAVLTIDPPADLVAGESYYLQIEPAAIDDLSGNNFGGITDATSWNFTADGTAPSVSSMDPSNGSANVLPTSSLSLTFDEAVQPGAGNITIHLASDGSVVETIGVTSGDVTVSGANVTIDPPAGLLLDTAYYVNIPGGAFSDLSGNAWPGLSGATAWAFTTAATTAIHHWEFEGDATDSIGSHHGTPNGNVGYAPGRIGQAATFDGAADFISTGASSLPATDFTLTAWVFATDTSDLNYVAGTQQSGNSGAFLRLEDGGIPLVNLLPPADPKRASGGTVPLNTWTHLAYTVSSTGGLVLYVDGSPVDSDPVGTGYTTHDNFTIGARPDGGTFGFDGLIDDVRIYQTVLPPAEIADLAGNAGGGDTTPPVVSSLSPADNAGAVAVNSDLVTTFNETVRKGSGDIVIKQNGGAPVETIPVGSGNATVSGTEVTVNPASDLAFATGYHINIASGAIEDLAGNAYPGIGDSTTWDFTTEPAATGITLLHHWKLDGDATDSVGTHDGTAEGGATYTTGGGGQFGEAIRLDGVNDAIRTGTNPIPSTDYTLTAWVFWEAGNTHRGTIAGGQNSGSEGEVFTMSRATDPNATDRKLFLNLLPNGGSSITESPDSTISTNVWQHVAYSVSSTGGTNLYLNGTVVGTNPALTTHTPSSLNNFTIGARPDSTTANPGWFDGLIDDVAVFDGVLDSTQLSNVITLGAENFAGAPNDFTTWISDPAFGLDPSEQGFTLDPDGDGIPNGLEAWFGTHPGQRTGGLANLATDGTTTTFTHPRNENPPTDLTGFYQWSPNLGDWYAGDGVDGPPGGATMTVSAESAGDTTTVTAEASEALGQVFLRVGVMQN